MIFALLAIMLVALSSCSDSRYDPESVPLISTSIHVITSDYVGFSPVQVNAVQQVNINRSEIVEIWGVISLNGIPVEASSLDTILSNTFWTLGTDTLLGNQVRRVFTKSGIDTMIFHAVDYQGDTIKDTLEVYVNTPLDLRVLSPMNKQLDIDPREAQGIRFQWNLQGVDAWEIPLVRLYLTNSIKNIDNMEMVAETRAQSIELPLLNSCPQDSVCRFYWMLKAMVQSPIPGGRSDQDSSGLSFFQTRKTSTDLGSIHMLIQTQESPLDTGVWVRGYHLSTGQQVDFSLDTSNGITFADSLLAGTWLIQAGDSVRREFAPESLTISLGQGVHHNLNQLITLMDVVPPQIQIDSISRSLVRFLISDRGSGILMDSLSYSITGNYNGMISYDTTQNSEAIITANALMNSSSAILTITGMDLAGNPTPECSWSLNQSSSGPILVSGPFCVTGVTP